MEIKKPTILISYEDNDQYTSVDCLHKYFEYLDKFEKKCSSFNENNCAHICNECNELNKNIYNLKRECHNQISPFAHLHKENEEINFCEKCTSECKYSKKTRCCNEGNIALKSDADQLCEGNNVSKDETVTIDEGSMLQTILDSQVSDPRSSESDNHGKQGEKHNAESEFKSEKENPEKQQETGTDNFEKNQEEVSSPMDDNRTTTPVKLQTTPECLSALSNSLNNTLTTNENNESSEKNLAQLSNSGITHQGNDSNKDITQSIIQVPQSNAQHISLKKNHNAVKEISYIITFVYKTFFSIVLSNIPFIKYVSHHVGANTSQGTPESSSSMCDGSQDTDNPSPDKEVPKGKSSSHFHTSHGNSGVEHAITDINIHISNTEEGTPDQRTHDNGTNEGVIPISALFDEMCDFAYFNMKFHLHCYIL
ncbi:hypothetical protein PGO_003000 [Plasmodium gonderi]|uniref:Variable surface protein n=1 Tax=Plasmodium gonderi TaxID=77519 RepID=A0A1Y1JUL8_PLAGO|nr:hypothetical protein PGO_003000 [Plasmodium gonderi]GAW84442.1 hypothetical protein PGO_003000 [Plasmodium gonderi]